MQPDGQRAQSLTCDITQGHEPVCIPLVGLSEDQVERLQSFEVRLGRWPLRPYEPTPKT
jgi:hypothetical protein